MKRELPNLYAIRFILSLFVIIYHLPLISKTLGLPYYNQLSLFHKGELSVFYFFTLSGFLIIRLIYLEMLTDKGFDIKRFYIRRLRRLYPVYYLVFSIGIFLYHVLLPLLHIQFQADYKISILILDYIFFIPNVFKINHPNVGSILTVLWSIGVEEQFYLVIPAVLLLFKRWILGVLTLLLGISLAVLFWDQLLYKYYNFYFYFIAGGLISILSLKKDVKLFYSPILHFIIYTAFLISFFSNIFIFNNEVLTHCVNLLISASLINLIANYPLFILKNKFLSYLGQISYGIYMYHMIITTGILFLIQKTNVFRLIKPFSFIIGLNLLVITLSVVAAHLSFKYFEILFYRNQLKAPSVDKTLIPNSV